MRGRPASPLTSPPALVSWPPRPRRGEGWPHAWRLGRAPVALAMVTLTAARSLPPRAGPSRGGAPGASARPHPRRLEVSLEPHAGLPVLLTPRSGKRRAGHACGQVVSAHSAPWPTPAGPTELVAERARARAANRQPCANPQRTWLTRGPATWSDAQTGRRQAHPQTMTPLADGSRERVVPSPAGGLAPRWGLLDAAQRHPHAPPTVTTPWLKPVTRPFTRVRHGAARPGRVQPRRRRPWRPGRNGGEPRAATRPPRARYRALTSGGARVRHRGPSAPRSTTSGVACSPPRPWTTPRAPRRTCSQALTARP